MEEAIPMIDIEHIVPKNISIRVMRIYKIILFVTKEILQIHIRTKLLRKNLLKKQRTFAVSTTKTAIIDV